MDRDNNAEGDTAFIVRSARLINGTRMTCPRCLGDNDILRFVPLEQSTQFQDETVPIYKCPDCRHLFAPLAVDDVVVRAA